MSASLRKFVNEQLRQRDLLALGLLSELNKDNLVKLVITVLETNKAIIYFEPLVPSDEDKYPELLDSDLAQHGFDDIDVLEFTMELAEVLQLTVNDLKTKFDITTKVKVWVDELYLALEKGND